jgi:hypothetical protein
MAITRKLKASRDSELDVRLEPMPTKGMIQTRLVAARVHTAQLLGVEVYSRSPS